MVRNAYSFLYSLHNLVYNFRRSLNQLQSSLSITQLKNLEAKLAEFKNAFGEEKNFLSADDVQKIFTFSDVKNSSGAATRSPSINRQPQRSPEQRAASHISRKNKPRI